MEEINDEILDSSPEEGVVEETPNDSEVEETPTTPQPKIEEKTVPYNRFKEVNDKLKSIEKKINSRSGSPDVLETIKLGKKLQDYSDEEIDFAIRVAKTTNPKDILEALENDMVQMAISAKREKVEKERLNLKPNSNQTESDKPMSFEEELENATVEEKEEILKRYGLGQEYPKRKDGPIIRV